jgi:hypothetical protein
VKNDIYRPQRMLLCTWIVELKLNEINNFQAQLDCKKDEDSLRVANQALQLIKGDFHSFLVEHSGDIHQDTIFQVL